MQFPYIPSLDLCTCTVSDFLICFVVEATDCGGPGGDFAFGSGGGGTRWEERPCKIEDAEIDLDDWNGGEFAREG